MNPVVHFEVPFDDKGRAMKFYSDVFGWRLQDMPEMKYVMAHTTEVDEKHMPREVAQINGGMMQRMAGEQCVIVMKVESVDATIAKLKSAGGQEVMSKMPVGDMGYYARAKDTEGNVIGVWEDMKK